MIAPGNRYDVFLSYSKEDKPIADAACANLEARRLRCWIAPRDILPGVNWGEAIIDAIRESRLLVLIFSASSNASPQVMREVERAVNKGMPIIPFRIEDVHTSKAMEYLISTPHWLDALTPPLEKHLDRLGETASLLLSRLSETEIQSTPISALQFNKTGGDVNSVIEEFAVQEIGTLEAGALKLYNLLRTLLGPRSHQIALKGEDDEPLLTKTCSVVLNRFNLIHPVENMAMQLVRKAAKETRSHTGYGAGITAILALELFLRSCKFIRDGANIISLEKGMETANDAVVQELRRISRNVKDNQGITAVATVAANSYMIGNETPVGKIVADAIEKVGTDGPIIVEESKSVETSLEVVEGMQFDRGYISPYFVTNPDTMEAVLEDALILIYDNKISAMKDLLPILEKVAQMGRPMLIIAEDVDGEALATSVVNKLRGTLRVAAVKAPGFGDRRIAILADIAILTGGQIFSERSGRKLENATISDLGKAKHIKIDKDNTTIVEGAGNSVDIKARIAQIKKQFETSISDYDKEKLQERLVKLAGGVAVLNVGATTEAEMKEKKTCVEDAVYASKGAIEEGVVIGGGAAFIHAKCILQNLELDGPEKLGVDIVDKSLSTLLRSIAENAGFDPGPILEKVQANASDFGFDVVSQKFGESTELGLVDSVKTLRIAIQNATKVACLLIDQKLRGFVMTDFVCSSTFSKKEDSPPKESQN